MSKFRLDEVDHQILDMLIDNTRIPFTDIAKKLLISAGTVHVRVKKMEDNDVIVTRIAQPTMDYINCIVNVNYSIFIEEKKNNTFTKIEESHKMRHFTSQEIKLFAEICGFELITSEEFLTKRETSNETWGVLYVLKKK